MCVCDLLVPRERFVEKVREGVAEVLVTEGPHAAQSPCASLRIGYQQKLLMQQINELRNLVTKQQVITCKSHVHCMNSHDLKGQSLSASQSG